MKQFISLPKLKKGDQVAIVSPSSGLPEIFPWVQNLGLERIKRIFSLIPKEYPTTRKMNSSLEDRAKDLMEAFADKDNKAVFASIGGSDQLKLIKYLDPQIFVSNPKPFFGYSDNSHLANFLWLHGIPSYYGGSIMTQFAMQKRMDSFTVKYLQRALFERGKFELEVSAVINDEGLNWSDPENLTKERIYEKNELWYWDGETSTEGFLWGGCLESIDDMLRNNILIPDLADFENIVLMTETSEELPSADYVYRVYRALGELGILTRIKGVLVGRPKAWEFDKIQSFNQKKIYRKKQEETICEVIRKYNKNIPIVQNLNFGHTDPQISMPYGGKVKIDSENKKIFAEF